MVSGRPVDPAAAAIPDECLCGRLHPCPVCWPDKIPPNTIPTLPLELGDT